MSRSQAVDTMPQFQGLVYTASSLMLEAKSHEAMNEPFEAAIACVDAGHASAKLGSELIREGHVKEGAQDIINAAHCFLEAGDYRLADQQLEQFGQLPQLNDLLRTDRQMADEHASVLRRRDQRHRELDRAREEMMRQMVEPGGAHRLKDSLLTKILGQLPGVVDFHFFAAEKYAHERRFKQAVQHARWATNLRRDDAGLQILLVYHLLNAKKEQEAAKASDEAVARLPDSALLRWFAAWARIQQALANKGPKQTLLEAAASHLEAAIRIGQLPEIQKVGVYCSMVLCLSQLGKEKQAQALLSRTVRDYPAPAGDLAWRMMRTRATKRQQLLLAELPKIMWPAAA